MLSAEQWNWNKYKNSAALIIWSENIHVYIICSVVAKWRPWLKIQILFKTFIYLEKKNSKDIDPDPKNQKGEEMFCVGDLLQFLLTTLPWGSLMPTQCHRSWEQVVDVLGQPTSCRGWGEKQRGILGSCGSMLPIRAGRCWTSPGMHRDRRSRGWQSWLGEGSDSHREKQRWRCHGGTKPDLSVLWNRWNLHNPGNKTLFFILLFKWNSACNAAETPHVH